MENSNETKPIKGKTAMKQKPVAREERHETKACFMSRKRKKKEGKKNTEQSYSEL